MPKDTQPPPPTALPSNEDRLRSALLRVLLPAAVGQPGRSIVDRVVLAAVVALVGPTNSTIRKAVGLDADLVDLVLDDLLDVGAITVTAGVYRTRKRGEDLVASDLDKEWRRVELLANCDQCEAVMGVSCISLDGHDTSPHTSRRRNARELTDNGVEGSSVDGASCA